MFMNTILSKANKNWIVTLQSLIYKSILAPSPDCEVTGDTCKGFIK